MGMKKTATTSIGTPPEGLINSVGNQVFTIPPVPSLPKTSVAPKSDPNGVSPVAPTSDKGLGKVLAVKSASGDNMSKQDWADKDARISIDAIHKSSLESPTLANLAIGKNDDEVLALTRKFFKYQLETNQLAKRGEL